MSSTERLYIPPPIGAPGRAAARKRRRRLQLTGLFVVSMATILLAVTALLHYRAVNAIQLTTWLPFTDGLTPGAPVEQAGYGIGTVTAITPVFPSSGEPSVCSATSNDAGAPNSQALTPCFQVRLRIERDWPIPRGSIAVIGSKLLKGTLVLIQPGTSPERLQDGDSLTGRADDSDLGVAANELLAKLTELLDHVQGIMDDTVQPLLGSINKQVGALQQLVVADGTGSDQGSDQGQNQGQGAALKDIAVVLNNLKQLTSDLAANGDSERDTDVGKLLRATRIAAENVEGITAAINDRSREIRKAVKQFTELGTRLNRLTANVSPSIEGSLSDTQYLIQEAATALTPILNSIDETTRNLLELSRDLRDNPAVLLRGRSTHDNSPR
jgi:phospholipid/cholesterol/gamma-HCH transport system substrate-binding protein